MLENFVRCICGRFHVFDWSVYVPRHDATQLLQRKSAFSCCHSRPFPLWRRQRKPPSPRTGLCIHRELNSRKNGISKTNIWTAGQENRGSGRSRGFGRILGRTILLRCPNLNRIPMYFWEIGTAFVLISFPSQCSNLHLQKVATPSLGKYAV